MLSHILNSTVRDEINLIAQPRVFILVIFILTRINIKCEITLD